MIHPITIHAVNSVLQFSKVAHNTAVDSLINYSHVSDTIPIWLQPYTDQFVHDFTLLGDWLGHVFLTFYLYIVC